jgi:Ca2+-binding RTX toxin-like protein
VVGGNGQGDFAFARLTSGGTLDSTFGDGGFVFQDVSGGNQQSNLRDIAVDAGNNIIAVGDASNISFSPQIAAPPPPLGATHAIIAKYDPSGAAVTDVAHDSTGGNASFGAVTVDSSGRYVAVGQDGADFLVERFLSNLQPDTSFAAGNSAFVLTDFGTGFDDSAFGTKVLGDGKIIAAGASSTPADTTIPAIARYKGVTGNNQPPPGSNEGNIDGVEGYANYQDLHMVPPPPQIQAIFNRISDGAKFILLSQPDDNGVVRMPLGDGNDNVQISIVHGGKDDTKGDHKLVAVNVNGTVLPYDPDTTTRIEIYGNGGDDTFAVNGDVKTTLLIDGGAGNDKIGGGKGDDILLGGPNNDVLDGREGKDILIGGTGTDNLLGNQEEDILIGGTTAYDANAAALAAISAEWASHDNFNARVDFIRNGGGANGVFVFHGGASATVFDDGVTDILDGKGAKDWFFARTTGAGADVLLGFGGGDILDVI